MSKASFQELQTIPGVGRAVAKDLMNLGFRHVADLKGKNPQEMYDELCVLQRQPIDRCMLYVFRCAVYFASTKHPDPEKLLWWNWKDAKR